MKGYVYILQSDRRGQYYVGSTNDVGRRVVQHKEGRVYSTRRLLPVKLVYKQEYSSLTEARKIERMIKKLKRHDFIDEIIRKGVIEFQGP